MHPRRGNGGRRSIGAAEVQRMMDLISPPGSPRRSAADGQGPSPGRDRRSPARAGLRRGIGEVPSDEEFAKAKKQLQIRLAAQGRKVSDVLKAESITSADLDRQVLWRLVWDRYLAKYRTPHRRETWFGNHHREIDGTELVVSQICFAPRRAPRLMGRPWRSGRSRSARRSFRGSSILRRRPKVFRRPQRQAGRQDRQDRPPRPMDEAFSRAAFELNAGEISRPTRTPFGVVLIRCDEVVPGAKKLADLSGAIDEALAKELLGKISRLERRRPRSNTPPPGRTSSQGRAKWRSSVRARCRFSLLEDIARLCIWLREVVSDIILKGAQL